MPPERSTLLRRALVGALAAGALLFAVQGGEFASTDLLRQRREKAHVARTIDSLQHVVDSLRRYAAAVAQDPAMQERVAREVFGMVRGDKEVLYRFTDTVGAKK